MKYYRVIFNEDLLQYMKTLFNSLKIDIEDGRLEGSSVNSLSYDYIWSICQDLERACLVNRGKI